MHFCVLNFVISIPVMYYFHDSYKSQVKVSHFMTDDQSIMVSGAHDQILITV
jgi:hypothetical protein